jgi:hypothetical protein
MNESDRKFLTEWGGEKCVLLDDGKYYSGLSVAGEPLPIRTFDTWNDFGWLQEQLKDRGLLHGFLAWFKQIIRGNLFTWELRRPFIRCQLICDFLGERKKREEETQMD